MKIKYTFEVDVDDYKAFSDIAIQNESPFINHSISKQFVNIVHKIDFRVFDCASGQKIKPNYINITQKKDDCLTCEIVINQDSIQFDLDKPQPKNDAEYIAFSLIEIIQTRCKSGFYEWGPGTTMPVREFFNRVKCKKLQNMKIVNSGLKRLEEYGLIKLETIHKEGQIGRPSTQITFLNQLFKEEVWTN